eukprot:gene15644-15791_t
MVNDISPERANAVRDEIRKAGHVAEAFAGDASLEADVAALEAATRQAFGDCTLLVNNAGHVHQSRFVDLTTADFDRMFAVHVR